MDTPLNWKGEIKYDGMVKIKTIADGSCYFHAFVSAFYIPYKTGIHQGKPINRRSLISQLRKRLSSKLGEKLDPNNPDSKRYYDILSRGELAKMSKGNPEMTLEYMQKELDSSRSLSADYNEFMSIIFDKDLYVLDEASQDVYMTAGSDIDMLFKDRDSIVLLYGGGHYSLVGLKEDGEISTLFTSAHPFIKMIKNRMKMRAGIK